MDMADRGVTPLVPARDTDMPMVEVRGGQVHGVSAILGAASGSGWE
ncbi:hypothetical protein [Sorangium sp. So ce1024]